MRFLSLLIMFSSFYLNFSAQNTYENEIFDFQNELNKHYSDTATSPLTEEDLLSFKSLDFFPVNKKYKVKANFIKVLSPLSVTLKTTTDRAPKYKIYAKVQFELEGKEYLLNVYQSETLSENEEYKDYLFLPFTDKTNGITSYGGGRYVDLKIPDTDVIVIDFNKAYNPYCAYNHKYSCVVPPTENNIDTEVKAGVRLIK